MPAGARLKGATLKLEVYDYYWAHYVLSPFKSLLRYGCVTGNDPLWFLLTLFLVRVVYTTLKKYHVSTIYIVSFCAFWGFLCNQLSIVTEPRYMGNFFTGLLFYSTGHFWTNFEGKILPPPYKKYLVASIMIFTILVYFVYPSAVDLFYNKTLYGNYFIWIIHSILCIITLNNLLKRVPDFQVLRSIGEYSMTYYVFHRLIIFGVQNVFIYLNLPSVGVPVFIWSSIMCIIFLPIITKYYKL